MKATDKIDPQTKRLYDEIAKVFNTDELKLSIFSSALGMAYLMSNELTQRKNSEVSKQAKYAILQTFWMTMIVRNIIQGDPDSSLTMLHMPVGGDSWKTDEDFEDRLIFVVQTYYEELVKAGKIKKPL